MAKIAPLNEENKYRQHVYGSTNPPDIMGTTMKAGGLWRVFNEKIHAMGMEGKELQQGHDFEEVIGRLGMKRLKELIGDEWPEDGFKMRWLNSMKNKTGDRLTFHDSIKVKEVFSAEEIAKIEEKTGVQDIASIEIPTNATPDFLIYSGTRSRKPYAGADAKLRIYQDWKLMRQSANEPIPGLPGSGKPFYGKELTNEVLPSDYDQIQWFFKHIPTMQRFYLFACEDVSPGNVIPFCVAPDPKRIRQLERGVALFHITYVMTGVEPPHDSSDYCSWVMKQREQKTDYLRPAEEAEFQLALEIGKAKLALSAAEDHLEGLKNQAKDSAKEDKGVTFGFGPAFDEHGVDLGKWTFNTTKKGRTLSLASFKTKLAAEIHQEFINN